MKVLHIAASLSYEWGGPTKVVAGLTEALAKKGIEITVFAPITDELKFAQINGVNVQIFKQSFPARIWTSCSLELARAVEREISKFDLIHIHEIWHHPQFIAYKAAIKAGKPYIITIHGELEPWCLSNKKIRKKVVSFLFQKKIIEDASALHALTQEEIKNISNYAENNNIFLIPNGIVIEEFEELSNEDCIKDMYPEIKDKKVILFLGRIHPKKGLELLIKAFSRIAKDRNDVCLLIVGPDSEGYQHTIEKICKTEGILNSVIITGMLIGRKKLAALRVANLFVLPSHSEGFSISILEALACGLPVVITKECNFPEVEKMGAGRVIERDVEQLSNNLIELLENPELCKTMGEKGKKMVRDTYTWDKIADKMVAVYETVMSLRLTKGNEN